MFYITFVLYNKHIEDIASIENVKSLVAKYGQDHIRIILVDNSDDKEFSVDDNTKEIIIATNSTLEGDTTALYLTKRLRSYENITVTRLASGLPSGGNLDYADDVTLMRAFQGRIRQ